MTDEPPTIYDDMEPSGEEYWKQRALKSESKTMIDELSQIVPDEEEQILRLRAGFEHWQRRAIKAEAQLKIAMEALEKHGAHMQGCAAAKYFGYKCTCGFDDAIAKINAPNA